MSQTSPSTVNKLKTWFLWSDAHVPFENKRSFNLCLKVIDRLRPYGQIIIGDFADFLSVSTHPKTPPEMRWQLKDEVEAVNKRLDQLDDFGSIEKHYFIGNHETRGQRVAMQHAIGLYDSLDPAHLFNLKERGWKCHPYQKSVKIGKVHFVHDIGFSGKYTVQNNGAAFEASTVQGHVHSAGLVFFGSAAGDRHVSATLGWLGSDEGAKYMAPIKLTRHWQQAFGLMRVEPNGNSHVQVIPIINNRCVVDGVLYE